MYVIQLNDWFHKRASGAAEILNNLLSSKNKSFLLYLIVMFTDRWLTLGIGNQVKLKRYHAAVALKGLGLCDLMKGKIAVT